MKKNILFLFLTFISVSAFSQKKEIVQRVKAILAEKQKNALYTEDRAAYLLDSTKSYTIEDSDSTLAFSVKIKYFPDGRIKFNEVYLDFFGAFYLNQETFYDKQKKDLVIRQDTYFSEDGIDFELYSIDSSFYDAKDRVVLVKTYTAETGSPEYSGYQKLTYNTPFATPNRKEFYASNLMTQVIELNQEEINTLDAKGNVLTKARKGLNFDDEFVSLDSMVFYYNVKNLVKEEVRFNWDDILENWELQYNILSTYNTNNSLKYSINKFDWNGQSWTEQDSVVYKYSATNKVNKIDNYFSIDEGVTYEPSSKTVVKFDKNDNPKREEIYELDGTNETFIQFNEYWWSFYKDAVSIKDIFSDEYKIVAANPLTVEQNITISSKNEGEFMLTVYDVKGQVIKKQKISSNQSFNLGLENAGTYVLFLTDKSNKPLTMKKIVKL